MQGRYTVNWPIVGVIGLLAGMGTARAATWTVDDDGPADFDNIQAAMDAANDGDEIMVLPGVYTGGVDFYKNVLLISSSGPAATIIDRMGQGRCITRTHGHMFPTGEGFTFRNGWSGNDGVGGAIYVYSGAFTVINCIFEENRAKYGGAIGMMATPVNATTLIDCRFIGNRAFHSGQGYGGAIYNPGALSVQDCIFAENSAAARSAFLSAFDD